jgi:hypothetical protein
VVVAPFSSIARCFTTPSSRIMAYLLLRTPIKGDEIVNPIAVANAAFPSAVQNVSASFSQSYSLENHSRFLPRKRIFPAAFWLLHHASL